ncbi:MAG: Holliday junction branch migration protein RuvA [Planctomycetota bacterium]
MICRLVGRIASVTESTVVVDIGNICYEVFVPLSALSDLQRLSGNEVTLFTLQYFDGNPAVGNLIPRLVGFLSETERDFFNELIKVKGLGIRKSLRTMSVPASQIALAIENGDEKALASLPELGRRTATHVIAQLRGKVQRFLTTIAAPTPVAEMSAAQRVALDILVHWGDRRADAQRWIAAAIEAEPDLDEAEAIVRTAYRLKQGARV